MSRVATVLLCLCAVGCALGAQPFQHALWKLWGHGVNARTPFSPAKSTPWESDLTLAGKMSCSFASWTIPFDSLESYGPFAIHPLDGRVFVGVVCNNLPYLWILPNAGGKGSLVKLAGTSCSATFPYAAGPFEGYFNFMPDASLVFGMCGNLVIYNCTTGTISQQSSGAWPAVVVGVANTNPPQLLWSGGHHVRWWDTWGMQSVNIGANNSVNATASAGVQDSTIMWGVNGTIMYNGHFNQWAPGNSYGLQYWKAPITAASQPYVSIAECAETRPWTFASDNAGNTYSSLCSGTVLAKYDAKGNNVWNLTSFEDSTQAVTLFLSDDEQFLYAGDAQASWYIVSAATGDVLHRFNISQAASVACNTTIYGPFAARWPVPFAGSLQFLTQCTTGATGTTFVTLDPVSKKTKKFSTTHGFSVTSVFIDAANNVYAIGTTAGGNKIHVERWTAKTI